MKEKQKNKCLICSQSFKNNKDCHVDHCHKTNKLRGLLCGNCNKGLGFFKDSPLFLRQAASYLEI